MVRTWQIQEAQANFKTLLRHSEQEGPQEITHHGRSVAVLLSRSEYARLAGTGSSLVEFMQRSPWYGESGDIHIERDQSLTREVDL